MPGLIEIAATDGELVNKERRQPLLALFFSSKIIGYSNE